MMPAARSSDRGFWLLCLGGAFCPALRPPRAGVAVALFALASSPYLLLKAFEGLE